MCERETSHARLLHAPECFTKYYSFLTARLSLIVLSLGSHSLVALPSNAAREEESCSSVRVG